MSDVQSVDNPSIRGEVVLNPDGTSIGGGGGTSGVEYNITPPTAVDGEVGTAQGDANYNTQVVEQYAPEYEDNVAGKAIVEERYTLTRRTTEGQLMTGAGFLRSINIAPTTSSPTAGLLTIYDSLTETGTILYTEWVFATTPGHTIPINSEVTNGVFVGFDATLANVSVTGSWRS